MVICLERGADLHIAQLMPCWLGVRKIIWPVKVMRCLIGYLMCAVMTNYIVYCMHALTVTSRPKLYIFNVTLTPVSIYLLNDSLMS